MPVLKKFSLHTLFISLACVLCLSLCPVQQVQALHYLLPQEPENRNVVSAVPEPGSGKVVFTLPVKAERNVRVHILDMLGRELKDTSYLRLAIPGEITMDLSSLHPGLYFFKFNYASAQWATKFSKTEE